MKHELGYASVDVPDDWEDRRTVQFVSPPMIVADPRLQATGKATTGARRSVIINVGELGKASLDEHAGQQLAVLQQALPGLVVNARGARAHPQYGACPTIDITVNAGTDNAARQILIFVPSDGAGKRFALLTYAARPGDPSTEAEVNALLASFHWSSS